MGKHLGNHLGLLWEELVPVFQPFHLLISLLPSPPATWMYFWAHQITEGVKPTLSELEKFEDQPEGIDLEVVTESTGRDRGHDLLLPRWPLGPSGNLAGSSSSRHVKPCPLWEGGSRAPLLGKKGSGVLRVLNATWLPSLPSALGKEREHNFQPGDNVEVCEGELINLQGKILSVDGNKITIMPKHEDLKVGAAPSFLGPFLVFMKVHKPRKTFTSQPCALLDPRGVTESASIKQDHLGVGSLQKRRWLALL